MRNGCTCRQGGKGGSAGVGKQVQHTNLPPRLLLLPLPDQRRTPLPVHRLLRKNPGMLEFKRLQMEGQRGIGDGPFLRKMVKLPLPSATAGTVIDSVRMLPLRRGSFRVPDHLRIRSLQDKISPPLQLFSTGAVDHFIALPVVRYPHRRSPSCIDINSMHTIRVLEVLILRIAGASIGCTRFSIRSAFIFTGIFEDHAERESGSVHSSKYPGR